MESDKTRKPEDDPQPAQAAKHVASARELLTELHKQANWSDRHPELQQAITELELALNILTIKTGALL